MHLFFLIFAFMIATVLCSSIGEAAAPPETRDAEVNKTLGKLQLVGGDVYRGEFAKRDDATGRAPGWPRAKPGRDVPNHGAP